MQQVSTSGVNVSWLFITNHSVGETAGAVAREREKHREREGRKQQIRDKVAHPVNKSGFHIEYGFIYKLLF
jgi:hypothetical protein